MKTRTAEQLANLLSAISARKTAQSLVKMGALDAAKQARKLVTLYIKSK